MGANEAVAAVAAEQRLDEVEEPMSVTTLSKNNVMSENVLSTHSREQTAENQIYLSSNVQGMGSGQIHSRQAKHTKTASSFREFDYS